MQVRERLDIRPEIVLAWHYALGVVQKVLMDGADEYQRHFVLVGFRFFPGKTVDDKPPPLGFPPILSHFVGIPSFVCRKGRKISHIRRMVHAAPPPMASSKP